MPPDTAILPENLRNRLEDLMAERISDATTIGCGYTPARRLRLCLESGKSVFVKAATTERTTDWLRTEAQVYDALQGSSFMANRIAWHDADGETFLILEDLSKSHWPPPWTSIQIERLCGALADVAASRHRIPFTLSRIADERSDFASWHRVAEEPESFLSLGLCSAAWLESALPTLVAADANAPLAGDDLLHLDIRSDNVCFRSGNGDPVIVDWNWICLGNRDLDIAGWLSSLHSEGGPSPETILPNAKEFSALLSGYWAYRAGTPPPEGAPRVREVQKRQLIFALPWAVRTLDLPPLDIR